jgi:hypothetical protein
MMSSIEEEILEIEKHIRTLESNDDSHKEINNVINEGMTKGLIYDFFNPQCQYRGTIFSANLIKEKEYEDFQKYINKCEREEYDKYLKWKEDIIKSGIEFSKDELKYNKMI